MPQPFIFLLTLLAVWRLTHLLHAEHGPFDLLRRLRDRAGQRFLGRLLDCFYCLSLWIALPLALLICDRSWQSLLLTWLALSGGAILAERLTAGHEVLHLPYREDLDSWDPDSEHEELTPIENGEGS